MRPLRHFVRQTRLVALSVTSLALLVIVAPGCTNDGRSVGEPTARTSGAAAEKVLMALSGTTATATPPAADGVQSVTIQGVPDVLVFSDRPERRAERVAIRRFVAAWPKVFTGDPPNAVLAGTLPDGTRSQMAVEVRGANVHGEVPSFRIHGIGADRHRQVRSELGQASLFIDDATVPACGGGGDGPQAQELCTTYVVYANTMIPFLSSF